MKNEKKTPLTTTTEIANEILRQHALGKAAYAEADKLTRKLARKVPKGTLINTAEGPHKVVNCFQGRDSVVAIAFARRLKLEKATKDDMKSASAPAPAPVAAAAESEVAA